MQDPAPGHPARKPFARLLWTAIADIGPRQDLGIGPKGQRYLIPILGGRFFAGDGVAGLNGIILQGGADRQLVRPDGVKELDAIYEMRTDAGQTLSIRNRVVVDDARQPDRYAMSVIAVTAPDGELAWLNRRLIVGTLQSMQPERAAVIVRAWEMDA